jgi:hypothetical protein
MARGHGAVKRGYAAAVRIAVGVAQLGIDAGLEALGDEVLQALGFIVQLVDVVVKHAMKEGLYQAVMPDNLECAAPAHVGKTDTAMAFVFHQRALRGGQLLEHVRDGSGRYLEAIG